MVTPRFVRSCLAVLSLSGLSSRAAAAQGDKVLLVYRAPDGEVIRFRDHFESWVGVGSRTPVAVLQIDVWRTETARLRGDTTEIVSVVDSARAISPSGPLMPEVAQTATMMRGTRQVTLLTAKGRELSYSSRGITVADIFAALTGDVAPHQDEYRQWRTVPEDSVPRGGEWNDSIRIRVDNVAWSGRIQYRLNGIERKDGRHVARVTSSGIIRPPAGEQVIVPLRVSSDHFVDAETGRLVSATITQDGGLSGRYVNIDIRNRWRIQRLR